MLLEEAIEESVYKIDQIPNHFPYQIAVPFVAPVLPVYIPSAVAMASGMQDCSLITPPDTPSPQTNNLSELFGAPRRCSSREHKQTNFFVVTELDAENPRKRKRNIMDGAAKIASRRMLKFNPSETVGPKDSTAFNPVPEFLQNTQVRMYIRKSTLKVEYCIIFTCV